MSVLPCVTCGKPSYYHKIKGGEWSEPILGACETFQEPRTEAEMLKAFLDGDETRHYEYLVCPYCGYGHGDMRELSSNEEEFECQGCGRKFDCKRQIDVTYIGRKKK